MSPRVITRDAALTNGAGQRQPNRMTPALIEFSLPETLVLADGIVKAPKPRINDILNVTRKNLHPNPSLESGGGNWFGFQTNYTGAAAARSNTWASRGSWSYHIIGTHSGTGSDPLGAYGPSTGLSAAPTQPGEYIAFSVEANVVDAASLGLRAELIWYDAAGNYFGGAFNGPFMTGTGVMRPYVFAPAPAGAAFVAGACYAYSNVNGDTVDFYLDGALFERSATIGTYFDGSTAGAIWTGGTDASISELATDAAAKAVTSRQSDSLSLADAIAKAIGHPIADSLPSLNDSFTDASGTAITSHTSDTNSTWLAHFTSAQTFFISNANRLRRGGGAGTALVYSNSTPPSPDYDVECLCVVLASASSIGPVARLDPAADTYYYVQYNAGLTRWELKKQVAGVNTSLPTYADTVANGDSRLVRLSVIGTAIKVYIDGVLRISTTDFSITAAGKAGFRATSTASDTSGMHVDWVTVSGSGITDSISIHPTKRQDDSVTLADSVAKAITLRPADSVALADSLFEHLGLTLSEILSLSDSLARTVAYSRSQDDAVTLADSLSKAIATRADDSLALADAMSSVTAYLRQVADAVGLSDSNAKAIGKTQQDSTSLSDATIKAVRKSLNDAASLTDVIFEAMALSFADSVALSDSLSRVATFGRRVDDAIVLTDGMRLIIGLRRDDSIGVADSLVKSVRRNIADALAIADDLEHRQGFGLALADSVALADALREVVALVLSDAVALTDALESSAAYKRSLADQTGLGDSLRKAIGATTSDSLSLQDSLAKALRLAVRDSLGIADEVAKRSSLRLADQLSLADLLQALTSYHFGIADSVAVVDSLRKAAGLRLGDGIDLFDVTDMIHELGGSGDVSKLDEGRAGMMSHGYGGVLLDSRPGRIDRDFPGEMRDDE